MMVQHKHPLVPQPQPMLELLVTGQSSHVQVSALWHPSDSFVVELAGEAAPFSSVDTRAAGVGSDLVGEVKLAGRG